MNSTKIFGWALLIIGLLIIFYIIFSSYQIFNGTQLPPALFKIEQEPEELPISPKTLTPEEKAEAIAREEFQKQFQKILPAETIPKLLNLISWSIFAGLLIFAGAQISGLGIKLIKK